MSYLAELHGLATIVVRISLNITQHSYWWYVITMTIFQQILLSSIKYDLDFKRNIWTRTGIRTSDLQITSLALLPNELSKLPFEFMFKRSSWYNIGWI